MKFFDKTDFLKDTQDIEFDENANQYIALYYEHFERSLLILSIICNLIFIFIIYKNKVTNSLPSNKPFRYLLSGLTLCDIWFLVTNAFGLNTIYSLSYEFLDNLLCRFGSYFTSFFSIFAECQMLAADYILIYVLFPHKKSNSNVYNDFLIDLKGRDTKLFVIKKNSFSEKINTDKESNHFDINEISVFSNNDSYNNNNNGNNAKYELSSDFSSKSIEIVNEINEKKYSETIKGRNFLDKPGKVMNKSNRYFKRKPTLRVALKNFKRRIHHSFQHDHMSKNKAVYNKMILKEKFSIILFSFVWIYLLSFFLWTQEYSSKDNYCKTHDSAEKFMILYRTCFILLQMITLFINLIVAVTYFVKFRMDSFKSILDSFKKDDQTFNESKTIKFKSFHFTYSTDLVIKENANSKDFLVNENNKNSKETHVNSNQIHYNHLIFVRNYVISTFFYSLLITPSILKKVMDLAVEMKLFATPYDSVNAHSTTQIHLTNKTNENVFDTFIFALEDETLLDHSKAHPINETLVSITEKLAHSLKIIVYLIFSVHIKCFFKFKR